MQKERKSAYLQVYDRVRGQIVQGAYGFGEKLPSKRTMAENFGVSVITVEHAYALLEEEGYLISRQRRGYFVSYRCGDTYVTEERGLSEEGRKGKQKSASPGKEKTVFPYAVYAKAVRRVLSEQGEEVLKEAPGTGCETLKEAIASYLFANRGIRVETSRIVIGSGAEYLYGLIPQMLGRERTYGLEDPGYEKIKRVYEADGVSCDLLKMGEQGILSGELRRTKASVLHVTPFHSYPTGVTAPVSKRLEYLDWAKKRNGMLIEDDFDSEFSPMGKRLDTLFSLDPEEHVLYTNTFTKTIAPAVRMGYMVLPKKHAAAFLKKISFYACPVPVLDQLVLATLLKNGDFVRHINRVRRQGRKS